jgi:hypothetical protein
MIRTLDHELHQMLPIIERQVVNQGAQMLAESPSRRERVAHGAVGRINPVKCAVRQEGQQDHGRKQVRQRRFAMAEVVFEVIPLGFERVLRYRRTTSYPFVVTARRGSRCHCGRSQRPIRTGVCATRPCRSTGSWRVVRAPARNAAGGNTDRRPDSGP